MRDDSTSHGILWFVAGVCAGAAIGSLLAPASGADTRRRLTSKAGDAGHLMAQSGRDYVAKAHELYEMGRKLADDAAEMFDEGRRLMEGEDYAATGR